MTITTYRLILPACFAIAALSASIHARAETMQELYQKAKAEKSVVFYSGGPAAPHETRAKLFMQQYPGITVSVTGGFSNVLNEKINQLRTHQHPFSRCHVQVGYVNLSVLHRCIE